MPQHEHNAKSSFDRMTVSFYLAKRGSRAKTGKLRGNIPPEGTRASYYLCKRDSCPIPGNALEDREKL
jgi:hypothetical protein